MVASGDPEARELLARVLGRAGHEVEQVDGPDTAMAALSSSARLALVALFRDDRTVALLRDVRAAEDATVSTVPVLVVADEDPAATAAAAAGADGTLTRPFHADELTGELDAVLARSPAERAERREAAAKRD